MVALACNKLFIPCRSSGGHTQASCRDAAIEPSPCFELGVPLNPCGGRTFYAFNARGYTDYPKYEAHEAAEACLV